MSGWNTRVSVKFDAFSVAMQAKVGGLQQLDIDALVTKAEQMLSSDDPLTRAVNSFATQYDIADERRRRELGEDLLATIQSMNMPEPPGQDRRDIYG